MGYQAVHITTNSSGAGSATISIPGDALFYGLQYIKTDYADGVDMTVTTSNSVIAATLLTITNMNAAASYYPRVDSCGATGTALSANTIMYPLMGKLTITIASGGDTTDGDFVVWYL